jgi:hypothetical protein
MLYTAEFEILEFEIFFSYLEMKNTNENIHMVKVNSLICLNTAAL